MQNIETPYSLPITEVLAELGVTADRGLNEGEIRQRRSVYGRNKLQETRPRSSLRVFLDQFRSSVVGLLAAAAVLSFIFADLPEGIAILAVIAINALIGFFTEMSAVRSMQALYQIGSVNTRVRRAGSTQEVPAADLVPGDIVILEGGDIITADLRLLQASKLQCDESALTGESVPVSKRTDPLDGERVLAERFNMVYKGTAVVRGSGEGVVTATGLNSELGKISSLVEEAKAERTPLEKRLDRLGRNLIWVILVVVVVVSLLGILRGKDAFMMVQTGIALAVASIPEGLPIVATIALSRGMLRMARRQALVRRLSSVETLGSATLICTDKTGTLTENRMTVTRVDTIGEIAKRNEAGSWAFGESGASPGPGSGLNEVLTICALCNNASLEKTDGGFETTGDPLEAALLLAANEAGIDRGKLLDDRPEVREEPFESETKMMATFHRVDDGFYVAAKGGPEAILGSCDRVLTLTGEKPFTEELKKNWLERNEAIAHDGFRVLATAYKSVSAVEEEPYSNLIFVGLVGLLDPPREDVRESLERCRKAGIRVVMVTGDQPATALYVAKTLGIVEEEETNVISGGQLGSVSDMSDEEKRSVLAVNIFARVDPKQKLDLIALHQEQGAIVAMTGDGINDAPALKKADIGVAMGLRGTQVAREVADVVLRDDSFRTIVYAIQEGRIIFGNIRKFVLYLLSCNVAEILVIFIAALVNSPLPILPLQILFLNFVTDVFPALALGVGEGDEGIMQRPPRRASDPILTRHHWGMIVGYGAVIALATLGAFSVARFFLEVELETAVTISFMTLAVSQLFHVINMRNRGTPLLTNEVSRNRYVWGALVLCFGLLALALYAPMLSDVLKTVPLSLGHWLLVIVAAIIPVVVDSVARSIYAARIRTP